jgi:hypothetical protein
MAQLRVTDASQLLEIKSEPYVIYSKRGYQPVIDVENVHTGDDGHLVITAQSLSDPLHEFAEKNDGNLTGIVIIVRKESKDRMSPYVVTCQ